MAKKKKKKAAARKTARKPAAKRRAAKKAGRGRPASVVAAFLVPGSPLPFVQRDNPPWGRLASAMQAAGKALDAARPDAVVVYSTQWIAVLDQLWQTRKRVTGIHVDENWHEYGDLPFDIRTDTALAEACIKGTQAAGIKAKGVDYDQFPVDTGTIVVANLMNAGKRPFVIGANNVYHDWQRTMLLGRIAAEAAAGLGKKIAVIGVGGLSGSFFRHGIDIRTDHIASRQEDQWNRRILKFMEEGDLARLQAQCPKYAMEAKVDMGFKHFAFLLGAMGGRFKSAKVHGYEPLYGTGGAVVEFRIS